MSRFLWFTVYNAPGAVLQTLLLRNCDVCTWRVLTFPRYRKLHV